jgi:hypothetical protein
VYDVVSRLVAKKEYGLENIDYHGDGDDARKLEDGESARAAVW